MTIFEAIKSLCQYGLNQHFYEQSDEIYIRNQLMTHLNLLHFESCEVVSLNYLELLKVMVDYAYEENIIESNLPPYSDLFESKIMNVLLPKPSEVIGNFQAYYSVSPMQGTGYFYDFSKKSHYIRLDRTSKNIQWEVESSYGMIDMTINLSKPEKDPKAIEAASKMAQNNYPKCLLCCENEGYSGHLNHPGRENHRIIPLRLTDEDWFFQYSPYAYFNEHAIVLKKEHEPMTINSKTFERLVDFVNQMPHYFIGSNADLPIVGGSMLSHDHYQAGQYVFPMEKATVDKTFEVDGVKVHYLNWPLTVLRVETKDQLELLKVTNKIFNKWLNYSDEEQAILAYSGDVRHNTITPILRKRDYVYQMDLVLRNNRTNEKYPDGIFHPHPYVHPVKKENIGLIEVMGLAVLPARLKEEMEEISELVYEGKVIPEHLKAFESLVSHIEKKSTKEQTLEATKEAIGQLFLEGLNHCGVFKRDEIGLKGINKFMNF
ncbi:MAG: UDP-glucose--hexose-1-phosphate uridylyltransferase [Clostridia bacterium]|nr:UDP-glucose--hexose-1-phosphate uridylyltransferase [Clostridia bacterium]